MDLEFPTWQLPYFDAVSEIPQGFLHRVAPTFEQTFQRDR
jgi:hypothetical protein